jgi:hypothetical protein
LFYKTATTGYIENASKESNEKCDKKSAETLFFVQCRKLTTFVTFIAREISGRKKNKTKLLFVFEEKKSCSCANFFF